MPYPFCGKYSMRIVFNLVGLTLLISLNAKAQEPKYYALFIAKFSESVSFKNASSAIKIGIYGAPSVYDELFKISKTKQNVEVYLIESVKEAYEVNVLFIGDSKSKEVDGIYKQIGNTVLLVAQSDLHARNAHINFFVEDGKLRFRVNRASLQVTEFTVSANLISLSR
jgi:hypothetical protein